MPRTARLWSVSERDQLCEIIASTVDLEVRLEEWLSQDITIISEDLLVIGRQVETDYGGYIDLLCLNAQGDLVIVELKRDKTPREIVSQVLDYASWVKDLSNEDVIRLGDQYLGDRGPLQGAFQRRFQTELPEILNEHHEMLVVASQIDASSERIIAYLSETYGVSINAITVQHFRDADGRGIVARVFLMDPSEVERQAQTRSRSKRRRNLSYDDLERQAEENGVAELYRELVTGLRRVFERPSPTQSWLSFAGTMDGSVNTIMSVVPSKSERDLGLYVQVYFDRFTAYFGLDEDAARSILPGDAEEWSPWAGAHGYAGHLATSEEVSRFVAALGQRRYAD